jgi:hypothetical protein
MLVRAMAAADVTWAARVMDQRRQLYAGYSPVFWRPARDAISLHTRFLARQIAAPRTIALRSDGGLLIAELRGPEVLIDDFAVTGEGRWPADIRRQAAKSGTLTCALAGIIVAQGDLVGLGDVVCLDGPQSLP